MPPTLQELIQQARNRRLGVATPPPEDETPLERAIREARERRMAAQESEEVLPPEPQDERGYLEKLLSELSPGAGARNLGVGLSRLPGTAVRGAETLSRVLMAPGVKLLNPLGLVDAVLPGTPVSDMMERGFSEARGSLDALEQRAAEYAPPPAETLPGKILQGAAQAVPQLAATVGTALATGGAALPVMALGGTLAAGESLREAEERDVDENVATLKALLSGAVSAPLEAIGARGVAAVFRRAGAQASKLAVRTARAMASEGASEVAQELSEIGLELATGSETALENAGERVFLAGTVGTLLAGSAGALARGIDAASPPPAPLSPGEAAAAPQLLASYEKHHTPPPGQAPGLGARVGNAWRRAIYEMQNKYAPVERMVKLIKKAGHDPTGPAREVFIAVSQAKAATQIASDSLRLRPLRAQRTFDAEGKEIDNNGRLLEHVTEIEVWNPRTQQVETVSNPEGFASPLEILSKYGNDETRLRMLSRFSVSQRITEDLAGRENVNVSEEQLQDAQNDMAAVNADPQLRARLEADADALRHWQIAAVLDPLVHVGYLSKESKFNILRENPHYAPLFKFELAEDMQPGGTVRAQQEQRATGAGSPSMKRIRNVDANTQDPLEGIMQKAMAVQGWVRRQQVRNLVAMLGDQYSDVFPDIHHVPPEVQRVATIETEDGEKQDIYRPKKEAPAGTFPVYRGGERFNYQADQLLLDSLDTLTPKQMLWVFRLMRPFAASLRAGATGTVEFTLTNSLFRDQVTNAMYAKFGFLPGWDTARGLAEAVKSGQLADEMAMSGGMMGNLVDVDRDWRIHTLQDLLAYEKRGSTPMQKAADLVLREARIYKTVLNKPFRTLKQLAKGERTMFDALADLPTEVFNMYLHPRQRLSALGEVANRFGSGKRAAEGSPILGRVSEGIKGGIKGVSKALGAGEERAERWGQLWAPRFRVEGQGRAEVMEAVSEPSMDFRTMGRLGAYFNTIDAFSNANIQDPFKFVKAIKEAPGHTILAGLVMVAVPTVLNWLRNHDDEEYQAIPRDERMLYYHPTTGGELPGGERLRLPRPIGVGNLLFGVLTEKFLDYMYDRNPAIKDELFQSLERDTPLGLFTQFPTTFVRPLYEAKPFNNEDPGYDNFRGLPLSNPGQMRLPAAMRANDWTSETSRRLGELTNTPPVKIDHIWNSWTGAGGREVFDISDAVLFGKEKSRREPGLLSNTPVTRRFASRRPIGPGSQPVSDFYELVKTADQQRQGLKQLMLQGQELTPAEQQQRFPMAGYAKTMSRVARKMSDISQARAAAIEDSDWDKKRRYDQMMTDLARKALEAAGLGRRSSDTDREVQKRLAQWIKAHPGATPAQQATARRRFYEELGGG